MMFAGSEKTEDKSYRSYRAQKFEKYVQRQKALVQGVKDSSLKEEDKKRLINAMIYWLYL